MNKNLAGLLVIVIAVCLSGCVSPPVRRQDYVDSHPALDKKIAAVILEGKICLQMTYDDVLASWGDPDDKTISVGEETITELWTFDAYHGYSSTSGSVIITFTNGKITGWDE